MKLGQSDINIGKIAFGCWRFAGHDIGTADTLIRTALDAGMNVIDTADIYGFSEFPDRDDKGFGQAELRLGEVLSDAPSLRKQMILATKGGIDAVRPYDSSYTYLMRAIDASLDRLNTDYVDLYQIHRPDLTTPMSEVARALNEMVDSGKSRLIGVSNFTVPQMRALQAHLKHPLTTIQPEFSRSTAALAFVRGFGADVLPIIGTQNPTRITESGYAAQINLTGREIYDIMEAYRGEAMP